MIIGMHQRTWLRRAALGMAACVLVAGTAGRAAAQDPAAPPPDPDKVTLNFFKGTEVGGLVDGYYQWYSTKQNGLYRAFDQSHNAFTVSMAEVWLAKAPASDSPIGYKIRMNFGRGVARLHAGRRRRLQVTSRKRTAATSTARRRSTSASSSPTPAPKSSRPRTTGTTRGRCSSSSTIPVYHAGIRMNYAANDKVSFMVGVVNGWNNVVENNTGKTFMASITLKPSPKFTFIENYIGGPETSGTNDNARNLSDTVIQWRAWRQAVPDGQPRLHQ